MSDRVSRGITLAVALTLGVSGCEGEASCGDGVRSAAEACDDGNRQSGDGCSASCELDDDSRTPGDDRPGYFWCAEDALSPGVTCPPDDLCCLTTGPSCATHDQGCLDPFNVSTCDGPEDCGSGSFCQTASHDRACRVGGVLTLCHTDRDCEDVSEWLPDGNCAETGVCEFELGDEAPWAP